MLQSRTSAANIDFVLLMRRLCLQDRSQPNSHGCMLFFGYRVDIAISLQCHCQLLGNACSSNILKSIACGCYILHSSCTQPPFSAICYPSVHVFSNILMRALQVAVHNFLSVPSVTHQCVFSAVYSFHVATTYS